MPGAARTLAALLAGALAAASADASSLVSVEAYGNQNTAGIVAVVSGDANGNATVALEWGTGAPSTAAHPLDPHGRDPLRGQPLPPGGRHRLPGRVTLSDPDGVTGAPSVTAAFADAHGRADPDGPAHAGTSHRPATTATPGRRPRCRCSTIQEAASLRAGGRPGLDRARRLPRERERSDFGQRGAAHRLPRHGPGVVLDGADARSRPASPGPPRRRRLRPRPGFRDRARGDRARPALPLRQPGRARGLGAGAPGGFFFDGTTLRRQVRERAARPPRTRCTWPASRTASSLDGRSFVRIEDLEIRHYGAGDFGKGVYLRYSLGLRGAAVAASTRSARPGVWVKGGDRHLIEGNEIWDTSISSWPWDFTKGSLRREQRRRLHRRRRARPHRAAEPHPRHLQRHRPLRPARAAGGAHERGGRLRERAVRHTDDAFEPEGYCANVRMWDNAIRDVHMAFAVAPGRARARSGSCATWPGASATRAPASWTGTWRARSRSTAASRRRWGRCCLYHNTFLTDAPGHRRHRPAQPGQLAPACARRNNVVAGTRYALYKVNAIPWNGTGTTSTRPIPRGSSRGWDALRDARRVPGGTGTGAEGLSAAPQLVNPPRATSGRHPGARSSTGASTCPASTTAGTAGRRTSARSSRSRPCRCSRSRTCRSRRARARSRSR